VNRIIKGKFRERQEVVPVVLAIIYEGAEVLLQRLVCPFGLSVSFGMVSCGEVDFSPHEIEKTTPKLSFKLGPAVRYDRVRDLSLGS